MSHARLEVAPTMEKVLSAVRAHCILIALGYVALRIIYLLWFHPLSDVPGPKMAALTDLWKMQAVISRCITTAIHEQHKKYGDVVRIGPNEISIIAPDEVQMRYGHKSKYLKGPFYDGRHLDNKTRTHFSDRDPVTHDQRRRSIAAAYSINYLVTLEKYCDACTDLLFRHLDEASDNGSVVDKFLEWYTLDCVSAIGFGQFFGLLEKGGDTTGVLSIMAGATQILSTVPTLTNFGWILPTKSVSWLTTAIMGDKGPDFFFKYGAKHVLARQALRERDPVAFEEEKDMLYRFMVSNDPVTSQPLDTRDIISNTLAIIVAGTESTRWSMIALLEHVYTHPPTLKHLRKEIEDAMTGDRLSFPITYAQGARLEFLGACIKEARRLHPAGGMPLQRVVPAGGRTIGGRFYRGGTLVGMVPREIHRDPRAYGKDAAEWRPDRWLEGDRGELEKPNLVWGGGTCVCLGKNISLMEMTKLIPTIIHNYDINIANPVQPHKISESWFMAHSEFFCSIKKLEYVG